MPASAVAGQAAASSSTKWRALAEWSAAAALCAYLLWTGVVPALQPPIRTDFPNYYIAARLWREGYPLDRLYEWTWMQRQKNRLHIDQPIVGYSQLTPLSALPVAPFATLPAMTAKRWWGWLNLAMLAATALLLKRSTALGWRRVLLIVGLAAGPLRTNFLLGQQYVLVLLLMTAAAALWLHRRDALAGGLLALAGGLKIFPLCFVIYFGWRRNWRALAGLAAGALCVAAASVELFGVAVNRAYAMQVFPFSVRGEGNDPYSTTWNSLTALLHRMLLFEPELNPRPVAHLPAVYAVAQPLIEVFLLFTIVWLAGGRDDDERSRLGFAAFTAALLVISPATGSYHLCVMILAAALATDDLLQRGMWRGALALLAAYAALSLPLPSLTKSAAGWTTIAAMPYLVVLLFVWGVFVGVLWRAKTGKRRDLAATVCVAAICFAVASGLQFRALRGRFENYAGRLPYAPAQFMESSPAVAPAGVIFTAMTATGYRAAIATNDTATYLPPAADGLHITAAPASPLAAAEIASEAGSSVVIFAAAQPRETLATIADAAQPAIAPDASKIAFLRFDRGCGVLWIAAIRGGTPQIRVPSANLDVMDVAFGPEGGLSVSAREITRFGRSDPQIYNVGLDAEQRAQWTLLIPGPARWPAVSPDGRALAFARLEAGVWNLHVAGITGAGERALTASSCNSIAPVWMSDSQALVYATDCGRGFLLTTLATLRAVR